MADASNPNDPSARLDELRREAARAADAARTRAQGALEQFRVAGNQLVDRVRGFIEEGNVRRITVRRGEKTLLEIPLTVGAGAGAAAVLFTPVLAALGALAVLVSELDLEIERDPDAASTGAAGATGTASATGVDAELGGEAAPNVGTTAGSTAADGGQTGATGDGSTGRTIGRGTPASEGGDAGI